MLHNVYRMTGKRTQHLGVTLHHGYATFRVWAPFAEHVSVLTPFLDVYNGSNKYEMTKEAGGIWAVDVKDVQPGQNYKFAITNNGEELARNDPYARALTASENGASVVAANDFEWGDDHFTPIPQNQQVIYELHVGTFNRKDPATNGTFYDAIEKLDYLESLGINMIELMPVTSMAHSNGWGYNVTELFSVENAYGGRHGLMEFVKACHARGIGVILDVVYNHFLSGDLWRFDGWSENDRGGIYFYNDIRGETPWGARPDYGRPEVRRFLLDNVIMWLTEFRIDGLRLDSTIYMRNTAGQNDDPEHDIADAWSLLQDIVTTAHRARPGATLIAEDISVNSFITKARQHGGCGFDAQWALNFPHALRQAIGLDTPYPADLIEQVMFRYNDNAFDRVIFSDSHDTAANGAVRLNEAVSPNNASSVEARQRVLLTSALTLTAGGIPMLLQGQEFLQEGAFNDWQMLEWDKTTQFAGMVEAHQHLIHLRRNAFGNTAGLLGQSTAIFHQNDTNHIIGYHRWDQGGAGDDVLVLVNFSGEAFDHYDIKLPRSGSWRVRFNSSWQGYSKDFKEKDPDLVMSDESQMAALSLPAYSALILSQDRG